MGTCSETRYHKRPCLCLEDEFAQAGTPVLPIVLPTTFNRTLFGGEDFAVAGK
jgi:hypothetical protein